MINDRSFPIDQLKNFLFENDTAFTHPLSDVLESHGTSLDEYAKKLSELSTIAYEEDDVTHKIKGVVIGYTHDLPEDGGSYITQVVTANAYRHQGVFKRIIQEYFDYCRDMNISYVWLTTGTNNFAARKAYESVGFHLVENDKPDMVKYVVLL